MKIVAGYILRHIMDEWIIVPVGERQNIYSSTGMLYLSESSAMLWKKLEQGANEDSLVDLLCEYYSIGRDIAVTDVSELLEILGKHRLLLKD